MFCNIQIQYSIYYNVSDRIEGGDVIGGDFDEDGIVGDDAENGGLDEFCHVDLVDLLNQFDGQGLHNVLAYNVMAHIENSMKLLTMKNRERGSITSTLKVNTLRGRWFNNLKAVNGDFPIRSAIEQGNGGIVLERDVVVELSVDFNGRQTHHKYQVIAVYNKYNNKYFLVKEGSVTVKDKGDQVFVYVAMIKQDPVTQNYVNVQPISSAFTKKDIWKRLNGADCIGHVIGKLSLLDIDLVPTATTLWLYSQ